MSLPKLELVGVGKTYPGSAVPAVEDVSLRVEPGETLALLGPSGCGKSTTLNMIVGLETPTRGDIRIDGVSVLGSPAGERNVGLVFQDYAVFTHMTVEANLAFGLSVRRVAPAEIRRRVSETAEMLGLGPVLRTRADRLGGSELQRVAIGRTLVTEPSLLLLDEPLSNLETEMRATMRRELRRLQAATGLTIIYVTHDQIEALSLAQRIAVMSNGRLRQCAPTGIVCEQPAHTFVAGFIGEPPMNLITGWLEAGDTGPVFAAPGFRVAAPAVAARAVPGHAVVLGVRPDAIRLGTGDGGLTAAVRQVEPRGPEAIVSLDLGSTRLAAVVPTETCPRAGERVGLTFDPGRMALFDGDTQRNLAEMHA
jgi:multiple sugar transport system ATP-binding protein